MTRLVSEAFDAVAREAGERAVIIEEGHALPYSRLLQWSEVISVRLERRPPGRADAAQLRCLRRVVLRGGAGLAIRKRYWVSTVCSSN